MAKKTYEGSVPYTSTVDWGGDSSTQNLPLSGEAVQKWIKENFAHKAGYFHISGSYCFVFGSATLYKEWVDAGEDQNSDLILGKFEVPSDYTANIQAKEKKMSAAYGTTGNTIEFVWNVMFKNSPINESVNCTITFTNGVNTKKSSFPIISSDTDYSYNVDPYLLAGVNYITISISGQQHPVSASDTIEFNYVNFGVSDTYDISKVYDPCDTKNKVVRVPFRLTGQGQYGIEWWWDGLEIKSADIDNGRIQQGSFSGTREIDLENMAPDGKVFSITSGVHSLQFRAFVDSNGTKFYSDTFYREVIINRSDSKLDLPVFAIKETIPKESFKLPKDNTPELIKLYGLEQFIPYDFSIATYYPGSIEYIETVVSLDGMDVSYPINLEKNKVYDLQITPTISGDSVLHIKSSEYSRNIETNIGTNKLGLQEDTTLLELYFKSDGRTNNSTNKDTWSYIDYNSVEHTAEFKNFDWTDMSGWSNNRLNFVTENELIFNNYNPFIDAEYGKTIEIEFSTNRVLDNDAIVCDLRGEDGSGLLITATEASVIVDGTKVSTKFKPEENVRISIVFEAIGVEKPLVMLYLDGILSGAIEWKGNISSDKEFRFIGSDDVSFTLKQIRVQNTTCDSKQIVNNFILYRDTSADMQLVYNRNNIYENGNFSVNKLAEVLPVMIVTGDIPYVDDQGAESKSLVTIMKKIQYIDYIHNKSFVFENGGMSCQGTSSMTYPKKNYRLYAEEKKLTNPNKGSWTYDPNHTGFFTMDVKDIDNRSAWTELKWEGKKEGKHKFYYSFKDKDEYDNGTPPGVTRWTIKADFAESSGTHNTGVARIWNQAMYSAKIGNSYPLRTVSQEYARMIGWENDVRTTVDGFPIAMFYQLTEESDLIFMGKYNFNNDKSNEELFGFTNIGEDDFLIDEQSGEMETGNPLSDAELALFKLSEVPESVRSYYNTPYAKLDDNNKYITWSYLEKQDDGSLVEKLKKSKKYKNRMQCWELTNSGAPASLFEKVDFEQLRGQTIAELGYEARYPDDADTPEDYNNDFNAYARQSQEYNRWWAFVYPFYSWLSSIRENCNITYDSSGNVDTWVMPKDVLDKFSAEKYYFMDVYKMAAYYIYLIRFGGVDQVVKNAMFTTDDGFHWYYINYDNDTIFGLNNLGNLAFDPFITRYTKLAGANDYDYAGRNSTLWNCLECDEDFMKKVEEVDDALKTHLSYSDMIKTFDTDSSSKWCETIYNRDAQYKYIQSYKDDSGGHEYLGSLQGARKMHRHWWISERFDYYDGEFNTSAWRSYSEGGTGCIINAAGLPSEHELVEITAGKTGWFGAYCDGRTLARQKLSSGSSMVINGLEGQTQIGSNYIILGAHNVYSIDISYASKYIKKLQFNGVNNSVLGSKLRKIILSSDTSEENTVLVPSDFKALREAVNLEYLDIRKFKGLTVLNGLETLKYLKTLRAGQSGLTTVSFANGAPIELLELPTSVRILTLSYLPNIEWKNIKFDNNDYSSVTNITTSSCPKLRESWEVLKKFTGLKNINLDVNWTNIEWNDLVNFLKNKQGSLSGIISVVNTPSNILELLSQENNLYWFGENCLDPNNKIYLKLPKGIYSKLTKTSIIEGMDTDEGKTEISYTFIEMNPSEVTTHFTQYYNNSVHINNNIITADELFDADTSVPVISYPKGNPTVSNQITLLVKDKVYPNLLNARISGDKSVDIEHTKEYTLEWNDTIKGLPNSYLWTVEGSDEACSFVKISNPKERTCSISLLERNANGQNLESLYNITLILTIENKKSKTTETIKFQKEISISQKEGMIFSKWSNPGLWSALENGFVPGWTEDVNTGKVTAFTNGDAEKITDIIAEKADGIINFEEFKYFTQVTNPSFAGCKTLQTITLPKNITHSFNSNGNRVYGIPDRMFYDCPSLTTVNLDDNGEDGKFIIGNSAFWNTYQNSNTVPEEQWSHLTTIGFWDKITTVGISAFYNCTELQSVNLVNCEDIGSNAFYMCTKLKDLVITDKVTSLGSSAFWGCRSLTSFYIPKNLVGNKIPQGLLAYCTNITSINIPDNITEIEDNAFVTTNIESVDLNNVTTIGEGAFQSTQLTTIELKDIVTSIGQGAFASTKIKSFTGRSPYVLNEKSTYLVDSPTYDSLTQTTYYRLYMVGAVSEFEFPDIITSIAKGAFTLNGTVTYIKIPTTITTLPDQVFYGCTSLRKVLLPSGLREIPSSAFGWCRNLIEVTTYFEGIDVDDSVNDLQYITSISSQAFYLCNSLTNFIFKDLTYIGDKAFAACSNIDTLKIYNSTPPTLANSAQTFGKVETYSDERMGSNVAKENRKIYIPAGSLDSYQAVDGWKSLSTQTYLYTYYETL